MSIFITSVGATDNEICAPFTLAILNQINRTGFKFRGIPAVESSIHMKHNEVGFNLKSCKYKTRQRMLKFDQVQQLLNDYRNNRALTPHVNELVNEMIEELEQIMSCRCSSDQSCAKCSMGNTIIN